MANDKLSWIFELVDKMTGPASKIRGALDKVTKSLGSSLNGGKIGQVLAKLPPFAQKAMFGMAQFFGSLKDKAGPVLGAVGKGLGATGSGILSLAGGVAGIAASVAAAAGGAVLGLASVGANYALEAFSFKENTMAGFETMLKSKAAAARVMADAIQFAAVTPFGTQEVIEAYRKLMVAGFKETDLRNVMNTVGDVGAAFGQEAMQSVIRGMGQIKAKGKLQGEELMQLSEAGIGSGAVFDALSKKLGKTRAEVQALVSAGKVDSTTGIAAILEAITTTISGGKAGSLMEKQGQTISGLLSSLQSRPFEFFIALDEQKILAPVKSFISALTAALDPKTVVGGRLVALLQTIGESMSSVFGKGGTSANDISNSLGKVLDVVEPLVKWTIKLGEGFFKALKPLGSMFASMGKMDPSKVENIGRAFGMVGFIMGEGIMLAVGAITMLIDMTGRAIDAGVGLVDTIRGWFSGLSDLPAELWKAGSDAVQGFLDGIKSRLPEIGLAFGPGPGGIAGEAIMGIRSGLDSHSPARAMMPPGADATLGFIEGVMQPDVAGAMADKFAPSSLAIGSISAAGSMPGPSVDGDAAVAGGGGRGISIALTVQASGGTTSEQAQSIADLVMEKLNTQLEEAAIELGVM